jgi:hypothetical protein
MDFKNVFYTLGKYELYIFVRMHVAVNNIHSKTFIVAYFNVSNTKFNARARLSRYV